MRALRQTFFAALEVLFRRCASAAIPVAEWFERVADWCAERAR